MTRKALLEKQQKKQKFAVREYSRCQRCGRARGYYRKFGLCRICLRGLAHDHKIPGVTKASWQVNMAVNDPIADFLTRIRTAHMAQHDTVEIPHSKKKAE